jgi:trehalose utilization protein
MAIRVTVWNEFRHEREHESVRKVYPEGIHTVIANHLEAQKSIKTRTVTLDDPQNGLSQRTINATDVLIWWGHMAHDEVKNRIVDRIQERVLEGMGLIVLHSGHFSKIFRRMMGTSCVLRWREDAKKEILWTTSPGHPIAEGIGEYFMVPQTEMYGEYFDIPTPDELVFMSWFEGGEVFRSGCVWKRGSGKVFYFRPGHETLPIYYQDEVMQVITNAVRYVAPTDHVIKPTVKHVEPVVDLEITHEVDADIHNK